MTAEPTVTPPEIEAGGAPKADPVARTILALVAGLPAGKSITPEDAARAFAETKAKSGDSPDLWRRYLPAVKQQALHLARQERIRILRKGKPVDPAGSVKGVIRLAPGGGV